MNRRERIIYLTSAAMIAAVYIALTMVFAPISFSFIQVRIAEILTITPLFTSAAIPGLFIGCFFANLLGDAIVYDILFGSLATLIGAIGGYMLRKNRWLVPLPAVLANTLIVPFVLKYGYGSEVPIILMMAYIFIGEMISCYLLGEILATALLKHPSIRKHIG